MFLLASSLFIYIGVYYGGQNDIVICAFATAAVYCLMDGRNKWFYFLAGMAISVKYFFFIPYVAIILLLEKRVLRIIYKIVLGIIPTGIYWLVTRACPMVSESASQGSPISVLLKEMVGGAFPVVYNNSISLFIGMLLIIYILAYLTSPQNDDEKYRYLIYYIVATCLAMLLFSTFQYYRVVMVCPFIAILMVIDKEKYRINVIMETIISISLFLILIIQSGLYLFVSSVVNKNVFKFVFGTSGVEENFSLGMDISCWISNDMLTILLQIFATVVVILSIFILVLNNPRAKLGFFKYTINKNGKMDILVKNIGCCYSCFLCFRQDDCIVYIIFLGENTMINFNVPPFIGTEMDYIKKAVENKKICGDGEFTKKCNAWLEEKTKTAKALLTTSCTHATEMAALFYAILKKAMR